MDSLPSYVSIIFLITVVTTFLFLVIGVKSAQQKKSDNNGMIVGIVLIMWLFTTGLLSLYEFYLDFNSLPPRIMIAVFFDIQILYHSSTPSTGRVF